MIVLRGGQVYDPANGRDGQVGDVWIDGERIAAPPAPGTPVEVIDATGWAVTPAAVEIHTHVAGAGLNLARSLTAAESASPALLPGAEQIARDYLRLGYTTLFDAAMPPLLAWRAHRDLARMPSVDRGAYTLVGDHAEVLAALRSGDPARLRQTLAWLLEVSGGYALKLVNPGVGLAWRRGAAIQGLDDALDAQGLTPRRILTGVAAAAVELGLPHPAHVHAGRLGQPGNAALLCETLRALEGLPAHFCHIQFFSYAAEDAGALRSAAGQVCDQLAACPRLTCDVGQVVFGPAAAVTADLQAVHWLQRAAGGRWACRVLGGEGGVGAMPLAYRASDAASAVQWATGLELLLRSPDPARMFLTTDYPNGGPFQAYPQALAWLMDRALRREALAQAHPAARERSGLAGLEREYRLDEVVAMTSWGPARALGLADRGHLSVGALADLRCLRLAAAPLEMFAAPALVLKRGQVVARDGQIVAQTPGRTLAARPAWDAALRPGFQARLRQAAGIDPAQYGLPAEAAEAADLEVVACTSKA
jgi:formylmethanofuran dehydrogenase subunit A